MPSLAERLVERINRFGPIPFADFVEAALYDDEGGFYATPGPGGRAGRRGADFLTSPTVGDLFGATLARALDRWWDDLGRPDPFVVAEAGAAGGTLARSILRAAPACAAALRYVLVERSAALRAEAARILPLEPPGWALGPAAAADDDDEEAGRQPGIGPVVTALSELPAGSVTGVVLANELLDNLPCRLLERAVGGWSEVRVGLEAGSFVEVLVPADDDLAAAADRAAPAAAAGSRVPVAIAAVEWLRSALAVVERGRVVVVDYADTTEAMAARPPDSWLRTYRAHGRGGPPLDAPGSQDITCEVPLDQLARVRPPHAVRSQAEFLRDHGIEELVVAARATWQERAAIGDIAALAARSRVGEADALTDPAGLGGFTVAEWVR